MSSAALMGDFHTFLVEWEKLPPLIRASVAATLVESLQMSIDRTYRAYGVDCAVGMKRRAEVSKRFMEAQKLLRTLAVCLTNNADDDATKAGIDLDVGSPQPDAPAENPAVVPSVWSEWRPENGPHPLKTEIRVVTSALTALDAVTDDLSKKIDALASADLTANEDAKAVKDLKKKKRGSKGGVARSKALSPEKRRSIAKKAADTRWGGKSRKG